MLPYSSFAIAKPIEFFAISIGLYPTGPTKYPTAKRSAYELIIECDPRVDLKAVCEQMVISPNRMPNIHLRADGYETDWYRKD